MASYERINGPDHSLTLETCYNLARVLVKKECFDEAEVLFRRELAGLEKDAGSDHTSILQTCSQLAYVLMSNGCISEAIILLRKYLIGTSASEDDICYLRYDLACYECLNGNLSEAKLILTEHLILHPEDFEMALNDVDLIEIKEFIQKKGLVQVNKRGTSKKQP